MFKIAAGKSSTKVRSEWSEPENWNEDIVETAGFVPLEVRFRKLQENGQRIILEAKEFDSVDMRKLYLDDEFRIEPDDELEEIQVKLQKRQDYIRSFQEKCQNPTNDTEPGKDRNKPVSSSESEVKDVPSDNVE